MFWIHVIVYFKVLTYNFKGTKFCIYFQNVCVCKCSIVSSIEEQKTCRDTDSGGVEITNTIYVYEIFIVTVSSVC